MKNIINTYKKKFVFIFFLLIIFSNSILHNTAKAQENDYHPKVGLVLSGGGAKGFAHLGLLELIDSLNIKIDYITGTSMGAIIGGLYSSGYSAKDIKTIIYNIDWSRILSDKIPLNEISFNEKSEYRQYLLELPLKKWLPSIPSSIIEGQYVSAVLNKYLYHVSDITDFDKLPIPIHIMTSDLINGGTIVQTKGSLPMAIRASMSLPGAFEPVHLDGKMLVDGGLDNNFPVLEAANMGADIIIGSYTGYKLILGNNIENVSQILSQAIALKSIEEAKYQMNYCDLLLDLNYSIKDYGVSDFNYFEEIIKIGEVEARKMIPQLLKIAEKQSVKNEKINTKNYNTTENFISKIEYYYHNGEKIVNAPTLTFLKSVIDLEEYNYYNYFEIQKQIDILYGTNLYKNVFFSITSENGYKKLNIFIKEQKTGTFKAALHYDLEEKTGILLNYSIYNYLGNRSRTMFTIDINERIKSKIHHYQHLDSRENFWYSLGANYQNLNSNNILLNTSSIRANRQDNYNRSDLTLSAGIGRSVFQNAGIELNFMFEFEQLNRNRNSLATAFDVYRTNNLYGHSNLAFQLIYKKNSMPDPYFPKKGSRMVGEIKYSFNNNYKIAKLNTLDSTSLTLYDYINPISEYYTKPAPPHFLRSYVNYEHRFEVNHFLTLGVNSALGFFIANKRFLKSTDYMYFNNSLTLGGFYEKDLNTNFSFAGLKEREFPLNGFWAISFLNQFNFTKNFYITPMFSYAWSVESVNIFNNLPNKNLSIWGMGLNLGYMTILGPINLGVSKAVIWDDFPLPFRVNFSIGYKF